jgi:tetratricopeptide (TPR) repeat protein
MSENPAPETLKEDGLRLFQEGQYPQALEKFEQARAAFQARGDEAAAGEMLNNLGVVYQRTGQWDQAELVLEAAVQLFGRLGDRHREAQAQGNLGSFYVSRGKRKRGMPLLQQAADTFKALGDRELQRVTLVALSRAALQGREMLAAVAYYEASLDLIDDPTAKQKALKRFFGVSSRMLSGR